MLPRIIVNDFGGQKTDAGMLGGGIYFADDIGYLDFEYFFLPLLLCVQKVLMLFI